MAPSFFPTRTASLWCGLIGLAGWLKAQATVIAFNDTGAAETWTAPSGVETISIKAMGAKGGPHGRRGHQQHQHPVRHRWRNPHGGRGQASVPDDIASLMASLPDDSVLDFGDVIRGCTAAGQGFQVGDQGEVGTQLRLSGLSGLGNGISLLSGVDQQRLAVNNTHPFTSFGVGLDATTLATGL